jgi:hypothetical protein
MVTPAWVAPGIRAARLCAVLAVAGVALVACGGGSSGSSGAGAQITTTPPVQSSAATTPSSQPTSSGAPASLTSFCKYAKTEKAQVASEEKAFALDSPAQLEKFEQEALSAITALSASAPAAVKSDVKLVVTTDEKVFADLKAAHFNFSKVNTSDLSKADSPAFVNAAHGIVAYFHQACGGSSGG